MIDHAENRLLVAGNNARRKNNRIVFADAHQAVIIHGDARKRGHRFGLRAAGEHHQLLRIEAADILRANHAAVWNMQFVKPVRDLDVVHHAAANEADFASHRARDVDDLLNAVDRTRKAGDHDFFRRTRGIIPPGAPPRISPRE